MVTSTRKELLSRIKNSGRFPKVRELLNGWKQGSSFRKKTPAIDGQMTLATLAREAKQSQPSTPTEVFAPLLVKLFWELIPQESLEVYLTQPMLAEVETFLGELEQSFSTQLESIITLAPEVATATNSAYFAFEWVRQQLLELLIQAKNRFAQIISPEGGADDDGSLLGRAAEEEEIEIALTKLRELALAVMFYQITNPEWFPSQAQPALQERYLFEVAQLFVLSQLDETQLATIFLDLENLTAQVFFQRLLGIRLTREDLQSSELTAAITWLATFTINNLTNRQAVSVS